MGFLTTTDEHKPRQRMEISDQTLTDLLVDDYMNELFDLAHAQDFRWQDFLTTDPEDLVYRRDILEEFRRLPDIVMKVRAVCQNIQEIQTVCQSPKNASFDIDNLHEFKLFKEAHDTLKDLEEALSEAIEQDQIHSPGLIRLHEVIVEKLRNHYAETFDGDWEKLTSGIETLGSYALRFTLDDELHTTSCAMTAIQKDKYVKKLLPFGSREGKRSEKLWTLAPIKEMRSPVDELLHDMMLIHYRQFLLTLKDMTQDLEDLYRDLNFYLAGLKYWSQMEEFGQELIFAQIRPMEEKAFTATDMIDPVLLLHRQSAVANDVDFQENGEILILTGMNQGGKTTYLRTIGTLQLIFQLGWPVAASKAVISPVEKVVTVFSHEENTQLKYGKLGQELKTLRTGMVEMTGCSLMLFNEPITGTSPMENLYLSREILSVCKIKGFHGVWVTHIYDLASGCDEINQALDGSLISSAIVKVEGEGENVRTSYKIVRGAPSYSSYARQVLHKEISEL